MSGFTAPLDAEQSPAPIAVDDVQAQLGRDEALALFLDTPERKPTPEETFVWVVTKTEMRSLCSGVGNVLLTHTVAALRCGLDYTAWQQDNCKELAGESYKCDALSRQVAAFRCGHRLPDVQGVTQAGQRASQGQDASAHRTLGGVDATAAASAGDRTARCWRTHAMADP